VKRTWFLYGLSFLGAIVLFFFFLSFILSFFLFYYHERGKVEPKVGVLEIKGIIADSKDYLLALREMLKRDDIKAVVLRIESPGGSVGASQEIYLELKRLSRIKPVVVSMGSVAASGGYYVALGGCPFMPFLELLQEV